MGPAFVVGRESQIWLYQSSTALSIPLYLSSYRCHSALALARIGGVVIKPTVILAPIISRLCHRYFFSWPLSLGQALPLSCVGSALSRPFRGIMLLLFGIAFELFQLKARRFWNLPGWPLYPASSHRRRKMTVLFSAGDSHVINIFGRCE